jgi:thiosulfate dehydrogenase
MNRSMNGRDLPIDGPEMQAIVAYIKFLSTGIPVGAETKGRGTAEVSLLERAADPAHGAAVYAQICVKCHGADGAGKRKGVVGDARGYEFPRSGDPTASMTAPA